MAATMSPPASAAAASNSSERGSSTSVPQEEAEAEAEGAREEVRRTVCAPAFSGRGPLAKHLHVTTGFNCMAPTRPLHPRRHGLV